MQTRKLGPAQVAEIGFGCMSLSHAYGDRPDRATAEAVLDKALDVGHTHLDTASLYGLGHNETLVGEVLGARRKDFHLASKCGLWIGTDGKRIIDGRPAALRQTLEDSLRRLRTDHIDLYYLHRMDPTLPIEDSAGALADFVREGKIGGYGLSEVSAATLRRAHAVHPVTALQTEYSLWTRNAEIAALQACKELGVAFVAFSPLARGYLTGRLTSIDQLEPKDIRRFMPRFDQANYPANLKLLQPLTAIAEELGCTLGQLSLAWVLAQGDHIIPIPGTGKLDHVVENAAAAAVRLAAETTARIGAIINQNTVHGPRYNAANQLDVDTEEFAA
jgi:aryl-alcohol dehydrogenase-like predicted oxidoreductase